MPAVGDCCDAADMNPWGITDTEAAFLDALCALWTVPAAARACGITLAAARSRLRCASLRMAGHKPGARFVVQVETTPTIGVCLQWSEWTRGHNSGFGGL